MDFLAAASSLVLVGNHVKSLVPTDVFSDVHSLTYVSGSVGSREGVTRTLPLEIYLVRESDPDAAVALSILLIAVAAVVVVGLGARRLTGWGADA